MLWGERVVLLLWLLLFSSTPEDHTWCDGVTGLSLMVEQKGGRQVLTAMQGHRNPPAFAARHLGESVMRRILCPLCSPDMFHLTEDFPQVKVGHPFFPRYLSKSVLAAEIESFSFSLSAPRPPGRLPHPPCLRPGLCDGTQKGLSQSKVTTTVSPPSQLTMFCLKVIIFIFLNPEAPNIQKNAFCGKGPNSNWVQPCSFHPNGAMDLCACLCQVPGNTTAKDANTLETLDPCRQNTLNKGGNENVNTVILSPLPLILF